MCTDQTAGVWAYGSLRLVLEFHTNGLFRCEVNELRRDMGAGSEREAVYENIAQAELADLLCGIIDDLCDGLSRDQLVFDLEGPF